MVDRFLVLRQSKFGFRLSRLSVCDWFAERHTRFIESWDGDTPFKWILYRCFLSIELSERGELFNRKVVEMEFPTSLLSKIMLLIELVILINTYRSLNLEKKKEYIKFSLNFHLYLNNVIKCEIILSCIEFFRKIKLISRIRWKFE